MIPYSTEEESVRENREAKKIIKGVVYGVSAFIILLLVIFCFPFYQIDAGERGVVLNWGAVSNNVAMQGLHFRIPIMQSIVKIDVRVQKEEADASAASKDLQTVDSKIALNYYVNPEMVKSVYTEFKQDYKIRLIQPSIQEAVKSATSNFTAEELITKRPEVGTMIKASLRERLEPKGIIVDNLSIVNFDFSPSFNKAIEDKVTAEQNALAAQNKLAQVKYEAQQAIEEAKGKAEAQSIEGQALRENPAVIQLRSIEKWNGVLPTFMGSGTVPFVNITK